MPRLPDLSTQERPTPRPPGGVTQLESRTGMEMVPSEQAIAEGHEFSQLGQKLQTQMDETEADAANVAYDNQRRQVLFGENGFYNKKGKDALGAMQPTTEAIEKLRTQVRDGLASKEQKKLYDYMSRRSTQFDLRSMSMHAVTEGNKYSLETNKAALINEVNNSGTYWNDPEKFGDSMGKIQYLVEQGARLTGLTDPESIKAQVTHWQSEARTAQIRSLSAVDPHAARTLFDSLPDGELDAKHKAQIDYQLTNREMVFDAKRKTEEAQLERQREKEEKAQLDAAYQALAQKYAAGKMTASDVVNSGLPGPAQFHLLNELRVQARMNKEESQAKVNQRVTQEMFSDIVNGKITDAAPILNAAISGKLDPSHTGVLLQWFEKSQQPGGLKYGHLIDGAAKTATRMLQGDIRIMDKALIPEAVNNFMFDLDARIKAADAEGKNPRFLVDPSKPENVLKPEIVRQFLPKKATDLNTAAKAIRSKAPVIGTVEKGYRYKGGDPGESASWEKV